MIQTLSSEIVNKSIILNIGMRFDKLKFFYVKHSNCKQFYDFTVKEAYHCV